MHRSPRRIVVALSTVLLFLALAVPVAAGPRSAEETPVAQSWLQWLRSTVVDPFIAWLPDPFPSYRPEELMPDAGNGLPPGIAQDGPTCNPGTTERGCGMDPDG